MPPRDGKAPFLPGLGGLRALAALAVLIGHAAAWVTPLPDSPGLYAPLARLTHCGLSAFFVLSGFVLQYNYGGSLGGGRLAVSRFALARLARVYPVYLLLLLAALAETLLRMPAAVTDWPANVLAFFTLTQSWFFLPEAPSLFPLAWAVSVEVFFYILFPSLARLLARLAAPGAVLALLLAGLGAAVALDGLVATQWPGLFASVFSRHPGFVDDPEVLAGVLFQWLTYASPYIRVFEFLLGAATARLFALRPGHVPGLAPAAVAGLALLLAIPVPKEAFFLGILENNILYAPFLAALCHALASRPAALVTGPILNRIGAASLSVYLLQPFLLPPWKSAAALASPLAWIPLALGGMASVVCGGLVLSRFVEAPLARLVLTRLAPTQSRPGEETGNRSPSDIPPGDTPAR